jgi:hypothetical protein
MINRYPEGPGATDHCLRCGQEIEYTEKGWIHKERSKGHIAVPLSHKEPVRPVTKGSFK